LAIRYFIDFRCPPRELLGADDLADLLVRQGRLHALLTQLPEDADPRQQVLREVIRTPEGEEVNEMPVLQAMQSLRALDEVCSHCEDCPASLGGPLTCFGHVPFPISGFAQRWLLEQLPPTDTELFHTFWRDVQDYGYGKDETLQRWRRAEFLVDWETPLFTAGDRRVTADQCLQALFVSGDIPPDRALDLLMQFRCMRTTSGVAGEELRAAIADWLEGAALVPPLLEFALEESKEDDDSSRYLKFFFFNLYRAFQMECVLAVRL
jgi:hypothetical protein